MYLFGFTIEMYYDAQTCERQKRVMHVQRCSLLQCNLLDKRM